MKIGLHASQVLFGARNLASCAHVPYVHVRRFLSMKHGEELEKVVRCINLLLPGELNTFSAAKYIEGHRITPHDDKAYTTCQLEDGKMVLCSRDIAVIYYLTEEWTREDGGLLLDLETGKEYVPEFNSLIAFKIPRMHEVPTP